MYDQFLQMNVGLGFVSFSGFCLKRSQFARVVVRTSSVVTHYESKRLPGKTRYFFNERRDACAMHAHSAVLAVTRCVCLSVCLSRDGDVSKRLSGWTWLSAYRLHSANPALLIRRFGCPLQKIRVYLPLQP